MALLPQVKPLSIRQTVRETIRRALLEGRFRPGQALSEVALASELKVSCGSAVWERAGNGRLFSPLRNLMVPYFAYGSAFRMSRPDLTPELLEAQHRSFTRFLSGDPAQAADQCIRFHLGL
jgi:DNA-binding GntR family transcriptional regulator